MSQLHCLGFTQAGQPRHPLYTQTRDGAGAFPIVVTRYTRSPKSLFGVLDLRVSSHIISEARIEISRRPQINPFAEQPG